MTKTKRIAIAAFAACLSSHALAASDAPAGNADAGKKIYAAFGCYQCHGTEAQGSPRTGPELVSPMPYAVFIQALRTPLAEMPPYEAKVVSDQQAADIYAFIQTLPDPPDYKTLELLKN